MKKKELKEKYQKRYTFVEMCRKDGMYVPIKGRVALFIKNGKIYDIGYRSGRWEERVNPIERPNEHRWVRVDDIKEKSKE